MNISQIKYAIERGVSYQEGNIIGVSGRVLAPRLSGKGYRVVGLPTPSGFSNEYVHKLVYYFETGDERAFDPDYEIHHINGIRHDNRFSNLDLLEAKTHESMSSNNNRRNAKIDFQDAENIRNLYKAGNISQRRVAEMFELSQQHVSDIITGKKWQHE